MIRVFLRGIIGELRHLRRERGVLLMLLGLPVFYPVVVSALYSADKVIERPALIVDHDGSSKSRQLAIYLDATQGLRVVDRLESVEEGVAALERRQAEVLVFIPPGFAREAGRKGRAPLKVWIYAANMLTYGTAYPAIFGATGALDAERGARFWFERGEGSEGAAARIAPLLNDERALFHPRGSYGAFMVPGVLLIVMQQLVLIALAFSVGASREEAMRLDGRWPLSHLLGVGTAQLGFYLLGAAFIVFVVFPVAGWPVVRPAALFGLFAAFILTMIPLSVTIARFVKDRYAAFEILMLLSIPIFMASGFAMPRAQMPEWVRLIAAVIPATPAMEALQALTSKTGDLAAVAPALRWMAWQACGFLGLALLVTRLDRRAPQPSEGQRPST